MEQSKDGARKGTAKKEGKKMRGSRNRRKWNGKK
jgi:hypothetical protein